MTYRAFSTIGERILTNPDNTQLTVQEKIIIEKEYIGYPKEPVGPSVGLLFHELTDKDPLSTRVFSTVTAGFLLLAFVALYPLIALLIRLSSSGPALSRQTCTGYRGLTFERYLFRTTHQSSNTRSNLRDKEQTFFVGKVLRATRLDELPSVINILRGEMKLVGPKVRPVSIDNYWNNKFTEYYKRFAIRPGLIGVKSSRIRQEETEKIRYMLKEELKYLLNPTLSTDLRIIASRL